MKVMKFRRPRTSVITSAPYTIAWSVPISKKEDVSIKKYISTQLQQSSCPILPHIIKERSVFRRFMWIVALSCCFALFAYFSEKFVKKFYQYPVVVDLVVENERQLLFPAVTFCNQNRMRKTELYGKTCKSQMDFCYQLQNIELSVLQQDDQNQTYRTYPECRKHRFNERSRHAEKILSFTHAYSRFSPMQRRKMSHQLNDMIVECTFAGEKCVYGDFTSFESFEYGTCYTFNGKWKSPKQGKKNQESPKDEMENRIRPEPKTEAGTDREERKRMNQGLHSEETEDNNVFASFEEREMKSDKPWPFSNSMKSTNKQLHMKIEETKPSFKLDSTQWKNYNAQFKQNENKIGNVFRGRKPFKLLNIPRKDELISTSFNQKNGLELVINLQREEYLAVTPKLGLRVLIHVKHDYPHPEDTGIDISAGFDTAFAVEENAIQRLEAPFKDRCQDYGRENATDQESCLRECFLNTAMETCNCVEPAQGFFTDKKLCDRMEEKHVCCMEETRKKFNLSMCNCSLSCRKVKYDVTLFSTMWPSESEFKLRGAGEDTYYEYRKGHLRMNVFFKTLDRVIYVQRPVYEHEEIFSQLGGQMGLWLGMSLMTIFEFVEDLALIILLLFRKYIYSR